MSKLDEKKEKISFLKFWLGIAVGSLLAIVGFCVSNLYKIELFILILSLVACVVLAGAVLVLSTKISQLIEDLKDL